MVGNEHHNGKMWIGNDTMMVRYEDTIVVENEHHRGKLWGRE